MKPKKITQKERLLGTISYLFGPSPVLSQLVCIAVIIIKKRSRYIRYHALQSLIFFTALQLSVFLLAYTLIGLILIPFILIAELVLWILFMLKSLKGEWFQLPVIGIFVSRQFLRK